MNLNEKKIVKIFVYMEAPNDFINSAEKLMADEFIKGCCLSFFETGDIKSCAYSKMLDLKTFLSNSINFKNEENVIYFDLMRLVLAIIKKYIK